MKYDNEKKCYFIYTSTDRLYGKELYWSNQLGWVDFKSATLFTQLERHNFNLPMSIDKTWIVAWGKI
jgi:hypothetical protein